MSNGIPSLLDDPVTRFLWERVHNPGSYENAAQSFWHHIYTKKSFPEPRYIVDYEDPPIIEEQGGRKIDQTVRVLLPEWGGLYVLLFHEIKRNEITLAELEHLESQAFTACQSYCKKHNIKEMYAQTSIGTRARFFYYNPPHWRPIDEKDLGSWAGYVEFEDPAGEAYILHWLNEIKLEGVKTPLIIWLWDVYRQKQYYVTPSYYVYEDGTKLVV